MNTENLGKNLKRYLEKNGHSQAWFCRKHNFNQQYLSDLIRGRKRAGLVIVLRVISATKLSLRALLK